MSNSLLSNKVTLSVQNNSLPQRTIGSNIGWKITKSKGRGIFAVDAIRKGTVIEESPVTIVPKTETDVIDQNMNGADSVIDGYLLRWRPEIKGQEYCLGHGYLMLYNHHGTPNAYMTYDFDLKTISLVAGRDIAAGEEITFDYDVELWFEFQD